MTTAIALPASPAPTTVQFLPTPPTDAETSRYVHREVALIITMGAISLACVTAIQVHFLLLDPWLLAVMPFLAFTLMYSLISVLVTLGTRNFDWDAHEQLVRNWRPLRYSSVDVMLPICREGIDVLANTWRHVEMMAAHYPGAVAVHVLDDGDSAEAAALAKRFGFNYLVRPNRGWFKKAGNLRHGYLNSSNDYLAVFDADFAPRYDFLNQLVPYMDTDRKLGIVQSPQYFRANRLQTTMERGAAAVQELFYRIGQVSRNQRDGAICVGSCALYRRVALDAIGGTTLIEHSEDVHTGFDLRRAGWDLRYVPIPLATGICPENPDSFLTQQYRWCSGSMSLLASKKFWTTRMKLRSRLCYLSGFLYYIHTAIFTFVTPVVPLVLIYFKPTHVVYGNFIWVVPAILYGLVIYPLWNRISYGPSALMARYLFSWAHVFAILDALRGRQRGWSVTGGVAAKADTRRIWVSMVALASVTSVLWLGGTAVRAAQYGENNWFVLQFGGLLYASIFLMAIRSRIRSAR